MAIEFTVEDEDGHWKWNLVCHDDNRIGRQSSSSSIFNDESAPFGLFIVR